MLFENCEPAASHGSVVGSGITILLAVGSGNEQNSETVEDEHQSKVHVGFARSAGEFFPGENAPESGDHGRGLTDGVGNGLTGELSGREVENGADAPDDSAEETE